MTYPSPADRSTPTACSTGLRRERRSEATAADDRAGNDQPWSTPAAPVPISGRGDGLLGPGALVDEVDHSLTAALAEENETLGLPGR